MDVLVRQILLIPMLIIAFFVDMRDKPQRVFTSSNLEITTSAGSWKKAKDLPTQRYDFGAAVAGGKLYIVGGLVLSTPWTPTDRVDAYDPVKEEWIHIASYPRVIHHPGVVSCGDDLYVVGGYWIRVLPSSYVYKYNASSDEWIKRADIPVGRGALGVTCHEETIYAVGGDSGNANQVTLLHAYDTKKDVWVTKTSMPSAREHLSVVTVDGKIYALGGLIKDRFHALNTNEMYDPYTDTWTPRASLPHAISGFAAVVKGESIFIFGGANGDTVSPEVYEYKTKEDKWYRRADMPTARYGLVAGQMLGNIHVVGGNHVVKGNFFSQDHDIFVP